MNNDTNKPLNSQDIGGVGLPPIPNVPVSPPSPTPPVSTSPVVPTPPSPKPVTPPTPPTLTSPVSTPEPKVDSGVPELPKIEVKVTEAPSMGMPSVEEKIEDKKMEVTVKTSSSGEPKPKRKISKRAVIASAIMAVFVAVLGVLAYQLPQFSGEQRGRACLSCPGGSCPDGFTYGPDTCSPQASCEQRAQEACSGHQGGGGCPGCEGGTVADGFVGACNLAQGGVGRCVCDHWEYTPTADCGGTGGAGTCVAGSHSFCVGYAPGPRNAPDGTQGNCFKNGGTDAAPLCGWDFAQVCTANQYYWGGSTLGCRRCNSGGTGYVSGCVTNTLCGSQYAGQGPASCSPTATATATAAPTATVTPPGVGGGTPGPCGSGLSCVAGSVTPPSGSHTCFAPGSGATQFCCPSGTTNVNGTCTSGACGSRAAGESCGTQNPCASNLRCLGGLCTASCGNDGQAPCCDGCHSGLPVNSGTGLCGAGISSSSDGVGGCCTPGAAVGSSNGCTTGSTCTVGNGACQSGTSCSAAATATVTPPSCSSVGSDCYPQARSGYTRCSTSGGTILYCRQISQNICNNTSGYCAGRADGTALNNQGTPRTGSQATFCTCRIRDNGSCYCQNPPGTSPTAAPTVPPGSSCASATQSCNSVACCTGQNLYCQGTTGNRTCQQDDGTGGNCGPGGVCGGSQGYRGHRCTNLTATGECLDNGQTFDTWDAARSYSAQNGCGQVDEICVGGTRPGSLCGGFEIINTSCGGPTTTITTTTTTTVTTTTTPGTTLACVNTRIFINGATTPATQAQMNALRIGDTIRMVVQGNAASLVGGRFIVRINGNDVSGGGFLVTNNLTPIQASGVREFYYDYPITLPGTYAIEGYVNTVPPTVTATTQPTATVTGTGVAGECTFIAGQYCDVTGGIVEACRGAQQGVGSCPNIGTQRQVCCAPLGSSGGGATLGANDDRGPFAAFIDEVTNRLKNLVSPNN